MLEYMSIGQSVHPMLSFAENCPAAQSVHLALPVLLLYFPVTHAVQGPPSRPDDPALQMQASRVMLPAGELAFVGQIEFSQLALPLSNEYFPCTH